MFWAKTITLANQNTAYNLAALMNAVDSARPQNCKNLEIQVPLEAGNVRLYIGDSSAVTNLNWGIELTGGQCWAPPPSPIFNVRDLANIWLYCDTAGTTLGVSME